MSTPAKRTMERTEAMEEMANARLEGWDNEDSLDAIIEGRIGLQEMSNAEVEEWYEEWTGEAVTIIGKEPIPLRVQYAAQDLLEALKGLYEHCAMTHKHWGEGSNQKQADAAIAAGLAAIAKAEGR